MNQRKWIALVTLLVGLKYIRLIDLFVDDEKQKNHKIYLLSNDNSSINLPTWKFDGFRKTINRPLPLAFQGFSKI